jgi:hypothetical protein
MVSAGSNCTDVGQPGRGPLNTYGVQIIPFTIFDTPAALTEFMKTWGFYSWKMKSASLQYQVVKAVPPQVISKKADANQGNPKVPSLNL